MDRYPRAARTAAVKCIDCNAPVVETVDGPFVCVECGDSPVQSKEARSKEAQSKDVQPKDVQSKGDEPPSRRTAAARGPK